MLEGANKRENREIFHYRPGRGAKGKRYQTKKGGGTERPEPRNR